MLRYSPGLYLGVLYRLVQYVSIIGFMLDKSWFLLQVTTLVLPEY